MLLGLTGSGALSLQRLDIVGGHGPAADAPMSARNLMHAHPGDGAHGFALDLDHRIGDLADHSLLLFFVEDAFDELNIHEWHECSFRVDLPGVWENPVCGATMPRRGDRRLVQQLNLLSTETELAAFVAKAYLMPRVQL
jgi:hypothetical protein